MRKFYFLEMELGQPPALKLYGWFVATEITLVILVWSLDGAKYLPRTCFFVIFRSTNLNKQLCCFLRRSCLCMRFVIGIHLKFVNNKI